MSNTYNKSIKNEVTVLEQNTEEMPEKQKKFLAWVKSHKTELILAGVSISVVIATILSVKNKDTLKKLWDQLKKEITKVDMYSSKWFETVTDETLNMEREKVRIAYCSSGDNFSEADRLEKLLNMFNKEISKRAWGDEIPHAPNINREHGWYLPNDD